MPPGPDGSILGGLINGAIILGGVAIVFSVGGFLLLHNGWTNLGYATLVVPGIILLTFTAAIAYLGVRT
jgi:hypothetical protein